MNELEQEQFEAELRRVAPAAVPAEFMARLNQARPQIRLAGPQVTRPEQELSWQFNLSAWLFRWLVPATALVGVALFVWRLSSPGLLTPATAQAPVITADNVQIDHKLVSDFDTVAQLPSGEPVRFRCRTWMDQVVLSDKNRGLLVEQRSPRVEIVPVSYETY